MGRFALTIGPAAGVVVATLLGIIAVGCSPGVPAPVSKPVLRLGYTPSEDIVADREASTTALAGYLERQLGQPVEIVPTASYGPAIEAMARGEIDVLSLGPFAYVIAARQGVAEACAVVGRRDSGPRTYQSAIVAHRRAGLSSVAELPARAGGLRFNFTDPASNSGYLMPKAFLARLGLMAERDFERCEFTLSHSVALFNLAFGDADVAGVSNSNLERLTAKGRLPMDDLVVLWRSDPMPNGPVAVRAGLDQDLKAALQRALVELPDREPETCAVVMEQYVEHGLVFLACDDSLFRSLRELAEKMDMAPGLER